jgi:hypothetical protein
MSPATTKPIALTAVALMYLLSHPDVTSAQAAAQIGGAPPMEVQLGLCTIGDVFGKITLITTDENCRSGCAQGVCPAGWMPTAADQCNAECGRVFEPFWDQCGEMLTQAHMGGMDEMGLFYDYCLEELYPPGSCGAFCNEHTYECYLTEVQRACCDEQGTNCHEGSDVPDVCPVGCAIVFPEFLETCHQHVAEATDPSINVADFESFEQQCLTSDGLALVEYALDLADRGCILDLSGSGRHRRLQFLLQRIGSRVTDCTWDELDDLAMDVTAICCADGACSEDSVVPSSCSPGCAVAMHQFTLSCGPALVAFDQDYDQILEFERSCLDEADPLFFLNAIKDAQCGVVGAIVEPEPEPEPEHSMQLTTIYIAGGYIGGGVRAISTAEMYDTTVGSTDLANMGVKRNAFGMTCLGTLICAVGGVDDNARGIMRSSECLDTQTGIWSAIAGLRTARSEHAIASVGDTMCAISGKGVNWAVDWGGLSSVECFNQLAGIWTEAAAVNHPRWRPAGAAIGNVIYMVGGNIRANGATSNVPVGTTNSVEALDLSVDGGTWTPKAAMPTARQNLGVATFGTRLFAAGGYGLNAVEVDALEIYESTTDSWTTATPVPTGRLNLATAIVSNTLFVLGGNYADVSTTPRGLAVVEAYDIESGTWSAAEPMDVPRQGFAAVAGP